MTSIPRVTVGQVVDLPDSLTNPTLHTSNGVAHRYHSGTRKWVVMFIWDSATQSSGGVVPCAVLCPFADIRPVSAIDPRIHYALKVGELGFIRADKSQTCCVTNQAAMVPLLECQRPGRPTNTNVLRVPERWTCIKGMFRTHWKDKLAPVKQNYARFFPLGPSSSSPRL